MKITGAMGVCEALLKEDVDVIFGFPGGAILPFYDALWHYPQLRHILVRHEQASAHAAEAYARVSGKVGVCVAAHHHGVCSWASHATVAPARAEAMRSTLMLAVARPCRPRNTCSPTTMG